MIIKWEGIGDALIGIFLALDSFVYSLVSSAYKIFMSLASARILSSDAYTEIANKIYVIIGVLMLFVLAYAIIKGIIDPDQMTKGEMGGPKIVKSVIVAVIGLAITPVVFNILYQAQGLFLEKDVIANIFFRSADDTYSFGNITLDGVTESDSETANNVSVNVDNVKYNEEVKNIGGAVTALETFKPFFRPYGNTCDEIALENCDPDIPIADQIVANPKEYYANAAMGFGLGCAAGIAVAVGGFLASFFTLGTSLLIAGGGVAACVTSAYNAGEAEKYTYDDEVSLSQAYVYVAQSGDFSIFRIFTDNVQNGEINYTFLLSTIFGAFICYVFVSFCIDMGMRAGKLAYYQIIAPIPLIMQILPKFKDSFKKYTSSVISTFMEVFIRISVVYVIVYIICHVNDMFSNIFNVGDSGLNWFEGTIAVALLIVGLVLFAKSAPKLISDTFGIQSGSLSLGIGKKLAEGGVYTTGAALGGAVTAATRGLTSRVVGKDKWVNSNGNVTLGSVAKNIVRTGASTVAGGISGGVRAGYNGRKATSVKDMQASASYGAREAVRRREERDAYADTHTNPTTGQRSFQYVVGGHAEDLGRTVMRWAGIDSLEGLEQEEARLNNLENAASKLKSEAQTTINKHADSNKSKTYGITTRFDLSSYNSGKTGSDIIDESRLGFSITDTFNTTILKNLKNAVEQARAGNGSYRGYTLAQWEALRGKYEADFVDELQNQALKSEANYRSINNAYGADIGSVRQAALDYREELRKNLGTAVIAGANEMTGMEYNKVTGAKQVDRTATRTTVDYHINNANIENDLYVNGGSALHRLADEIKRERNEIHAKKVKIQQREQKNEGNKK